MGWRSLFQAKFAFLKWVECRRVASSDWPLTAWAERRFELQSGWLSAGKGKLLPGGLGGQALLRRGKERFPMKSPSFRQTGWEALIWMEPLHQGKRQTIVFPFAWCLLSVGLVHKYMYAQWSLSKIRSVYIYITNWDFKILSAIFFLFIRINTWKTSSIQMPVTPQLEPNIGE